MNNLSNIQESVLKSFCADEDDNRDFLKRPFQLGEYSCASDGHIAVFTKGDCGNSLGRAGPEKLLKDKLVSIPAVFSPFPDVVIPPQKFENCEECEGNGTVELENDFNSYEFTCKSCDGRCNHEVKETVTFDGSDLKFDAKYVRKLAKLPNVQIAIDSEKLCFQFEPGVGFVMATN